MTEAPSKLRFQPRPSPVLPEHRPLYKIAQVALVLHASRAGKSSLARLHLFNWAFKTSERIERLSQATRTKTLTVPAWGFDPALAIALRYAQAEDLVVSLKNGGYGLTDLGQIFAKSIMEQGDALVAEKQLLTTAGMGITETLVDAIAKGWEKK